MAKQFDLDLWYRENVVNRQTTINVGGYKAKLVGQPALHTAESYAELAREQVKAPKLATPKGETAGGMTASTSGEVTKEKLAKLFIAYESQDADTPIIPEPSRNGRKKTPPVADPVVN